MRKNVLRELLRADRPSLGTHISSSWPATVELVGHSRSFDYVEFVGEYAPFDLYSLENIGRAIDLFDHMSGMMKLDQQPRTYLAVRCIGSGIQNVLFADVRTVEDARECVRSVRAETPAAGGLHGVGMRRDVGYVLEGGSPAFVQALDDAVVALMIEKKEAVENLEGILSVPGIDMVQFGASDYSMSLGLTGQTSHPAVREAETFTIETALKKGIAPRVELADPNQAQRYLDMGIKHFCMGWDVSIYYQWCREAGAGMRQLLQGDSAPTTPTVAADPNGAQRASTDLYRAN
jgi:2-keto-3-deoxy-L-rhamnonate aldolase RhmA